MSIEIEIKTVHQIYYFESDGSKSVQCFIWSGLRNIFARKLLGFDNNNNNIFPNLEYIAKYSSSILSELVIFGQNFNSSGMPQSAYYITKNGGSVYILCCETTTS